MSEAIDIDHLRQWIGKQEIQVDTVSPLPITALSATLDHPVQEITHNHQLPALWHWLFFLPMHRQSEIDQSGHARLGGFLPAVPLPRRMWAGSQLEFHHPITVGDTFVRRSTIQNVTYKSGRTGELVFVKVQHQIERDHDQQKLITEYHDIVYRAAQNTKTQMPNCIAAPDSANWQHQITTDDVLLFRYSALTFNSHRIHYDRRYAQDIEGYPGLIVHGPLIATLLLDALRKEMNDPLIRQFQFKAIKPVFDVNPFYVCGKILEKDNNKTSTTNVKLWAKDHLGDLTMEASASVTGN